MAIRKTGISPNGHQTAFGLTQVAMRNGNQTNQDQPKWALDRIWISPSGQQTKWQLDKLGLAQMELA